MSFWKVKESCDWTRFSKAFLKKKSSYLRLQPDKARPEFLQLEPEKSGHDSIFVDLVGACWCCVHRCCRRLAPQSFLPLLEKKKKKVPIKFHLAKQVNSSANKVETDFFRSIFFIKLTDSTENKVSSEYILENNSSLLLCTYIFLPSI